MPVVRRRDNCELSACSLPNYVLLLLVISLIQLTPLESSLYRMNRLGLAARPSDNRMVRSDVGR